ncbi:MAG: DMT family transporter [Desulfobacterales bacterium]|nr:DMT family transporter [Desulfobacterales bacterium]
MVSVGFAVAACMGWGIADFIGGLKSREIPTLRVLIIANGTGVVLLGCILAASGRPMPVDAGLLWAVPAGLTGIAAMYLLYRSLAVGTMSVLAPISATGALLPVVWGLFAGEVLSVAAITGLATAFLGAVLAAMEPGNSQGSNPKGSPQGDVNSGRWTCGIHLALGAAVCIGFYFILMDRACVSDPLWASAAMRSTTFVFLLPLILLNGLAGPAGNGAKPKLSSYLPLIIFMGMMDTLAAFSFTLAASSGMLSIAAVVSSLYPAVTVVLSALVLKERLRPVQLTGVVLAMAGVAMVTVF